VIWSLEWRIARRARRLFAFNVLVPLALVTPIAWSAAPRAHAAMVYTLLVVFFGTFGSAIPLVRDAESGLFGRLVLAGVPERRLIMQRIAATAAIDALQLLPMMTVIVVTGVAAPHVLAPLLLATALSLLAANALGAWIAAAARSIAEAALLASVVVLFALHLSGVFRTPPPGTLAAHVELLLPFHFLHDSMRGAAGATMAPGAWSAAAATAISVALGLVLTLLASRKIANALLRVRRV
jgi:hypothetical protein